MNAFTRMFRPLGDATRAFFKHDLALRRGDQGVEIVLAPRPSAGSAVVESRADLAARKANAELELMCKQLAHVLDEQPGTREAMRHLSFVEQALVKKGLKALQKLPLDLLQKALEQFEGLVTNWSPVGLAALRSKMAVAIIDREYEQPEQPDEDIYRTAAVLDAQPRPAPPPAAEELSEDAALAAAYAALGAAAPAPPSAVEMQGDLDSNSARTLGRGGLRDAEPLPEIRLRELQT
jgi:hypothetical protein